MPTAGGVIGRRGTPAEDGAAPPFRPALMAEVELGRPLAAVPCEAGLSVADYERAFVLVRLHTRPLGVVELSCPGAELAGDALSAPIWRSLGAEIAAHLRDDGRPVPAELPGAGYRSPDVPRCLRSRGRTLDRAPFISVVVPTHERPVPLRACLESLLVVDYPAFEVLVVDNTPSGPATERVVAEIGAGARVPVRYLREDAPGASAARNLGLREAAAELVAFADDDVLVDRHWLTALAEGFEAAEDVACVTGPVLPLRFETRAQAWMEQFAEFRTGFRREVFDLGPHRSRRPLYPYNPGTFGSGGGMAFRKAALEAVGGFDTALGPASPARSGEELAAFLAVILRGHRIVFEPAAIVRHDEILDPAALRRRVFGYGIGLGAFLTKTLIDHPRLWLDVAAKLPYGAYLMVSARSPKHARRTADFPHALNVIELVGILAGPLAYLLGLARRHLHAG
jgi:O-antigen biosynthesis protein